MMRHAHLSRPFVGRRRPHAGPRAAVAGRRPTYVGAIYLYWGAPLVATQLAYTAGLLGDRLVFVAFSFILTGYMSHEIWAYVRFNKERWVSPVVLASIVMFILPFGVSNLLFLLPVRYAEVLAELLMSGLTFADMNKAMLLAVLGGIAMWWGYRRTAGVRVGNTLRKTLLASNFMVRSFRPNVAFVGACIVLSLVARLWMVRLGIFGYSSDMDQLRLTAGFSQYLKMMEKMGLLSLLILSIAHYGSGGKGVGLVFRAVLVNEVAWGLLSGFKFAVILPFVIITLTRFAVERRLSKNTILLTLLALFGAYYIVEPFRYLRYSNQDFNSTDLGSITETFLLAADAEEGHVGGTEFGGSVATAIPVAFLMRMNLTVFAAKAVEYADRGVVSANTPDFLGNILLAPVYAFVPRFIWTEKAKSTAGSWFSVEVMSWSETTATAMSTVAYLNFAGGVVGVILGFAFLGMVQRGVYQGAFVHASGFLLVYVILVNASAYIDSEYWTFIVNFIRLVPIALIIQRLAFHRR